MGSIEAYHSISEMIGAGFSDSRNGRRGVLEIRGSLLGGGAALITDDGLAVAAALIVGDAHEKDVIVDALPMTGAAFRGGAFRGGASRVVPSKKPCDVSGVGSQSRRIDGSGGAASNIISVAREPVAQSVHEEFAHLNRPRLVGIDGIESLAQVAARLDADLTLAHEGGELVKVELAVAISVHSCTRTHTQ